jgi:hypothetical protein
MPDDTDRTRDSDEHEKEKRERERINERGKKLDIFVYAVEIVRSIFGL